MRKFAKKQEEAEVNMTPMLDIVFIMLIFFIVTASFVKETGLDANKPPDSNQPPEDPDKKNCLIRIDNNNNIFFGVRRIDVSSIRPNIEQCRAKNPEATVVIQPGPDTHTGYIVRAYDEARKVSRDIPVSLADPTTS